MERVFMVRLSYRDFLVALVTHHCQGSFLRGVGDILHSFAARVRTWALFHFGEAPIALPGPEILPVSPGDAVSYLVHYSEQIYRAMWMLMALLG